MTAPNKITKDSKILLVYLLVILPIICVGYVWCTNAHSAKTPSVVAPVSQVQPQDNPPTVNQLLTLVNEERSKAGVAPLTIDERLNTSAQRKADDMIKYNYYAHISPNDGKHGYEYINDVGIACTTDAENIDENTSSLTTVTAWHNSPTHYVAMTKSDYNTTGFGISAKDSHGYYLVVEHFCQQ